MFKRMMIMQALIAVLAQLMLAGTALGITMINAEQEVRARIRYYEGEENEYIAAQEIDSVSPPGLEDVDFSASVSTFSSSASASLTSLFGGDQVIVNGSTASSAAWSVHPDNASSLNGNGQSTFWLHFTPGPSSAYIYIDGLLNVGVSGYPGLFPEQACTWIWLERIENVGLTRVFEAELDGSDPQTSKQVNDGLLLEADREYILVAFAESTTPAWSEYPFSKSHTSSFSLTATFTCIVPDVLDMTEVDAETVLNNAGFVKGVVTYDNSDTVDVGYVMAQNPSAGADVDCGSAVDLVICYEKEVLPLPDLIGEFDRLRFRPPANPGGKSTVSIIVTNMGFAATERKKVMDIDIYLRPCGVIGDGQDILLMILADLRIGGLRPGASRKFNAKLPLINLPETGEYRLVAKIDSSYDIVEMAEFNNTALSDCFEFVVE